MNFSTWNSLIQLSITFILSLLTLYFQCQMILLKSQKKVSTHLKMNMAMWIFTSAAALVYSGHILLMFRGEGTLYSVFIISITGTIYFTLLTSLSLSVFCLLLDRCLILTWPIQYKNTYKARLDIIFSILIISNFVIVLGSHLYSGLTPGDYTTCMSAGCLSNPSRNTISIAAKFGYGALNAILAIVFSILLFKYNKNHVMSNSIARRANVTASVAIISEIVFSVVPNFAVLISFYLLEVGITKSLGPFVSTLASLDGICTTLSYIKVLGWDIRISGWIQPGTKTIKPSAAANMTVNVVNK